MAKTFSSTRLSKRSLLVGATAGTLSSALPTWLKAAAADTFDLIVIGAGTAGMPAAIFAAERGGKVLVVEKSPVLGGTLVRSTGQIAGAGTVFQKAKGIEDSPDAHYADNMRINNSTADPVLTRLFVDNAGASINWLAANGYKVLDNHPTIGGGHENFTTRRYQWGAEGGITILKVMKPLYKKAEASGRVTTLMSTGVVDLIQDNAGDVVGVMTENDDGERADYFGKNVLIASGGFAANPRMFQDIHNVPLTAQTAYPYSQGMGLTLGQSAGGYIRGQNKFATLFGGLLSDNNYPSPMESYFSANPETRPPWEIYVNVHGQRFVREDHPSVDFREHALGEQPGLRMWVIADHEMMTKAKPFVGGWSVDQMMDGFKTHPMFSTARNLDGLAVKAGLNPQGLTSSVAGFNTAIDEGMPDPMGRNHRPVKIAKPPFYAVCMTGWTVVSFAGLSVDGQLRVIRPNGAAIPNLYAAGEVLGFASLSGKAYTNGASVTPAITFGQLLGQKMLNFSA